MRLRPASIVVASLLLVSAAAHAQSTAADRASARVEAEAGLAIMDKDPRGALARFDRALGMAQMPSLAVLSARCLEKLGRLVEAGERYRQASGMAIDATLAEEHRRVQVAAQQEAEAARRKLLERIPRVAIVLQGAAPADVELRIDDQPVTVAAIGGERLVDPGKHRFEVRRDGDVAVQEATIAEGERGRVVLVLPLGKPKPVVVKPGVAPLPAERSGTTPRVVGGVVTALGGAGLIVGGITWGLALGKNSTLAKACDNGICHTDVADTLSTYNTLRTTTIAAMIAGGALTTAGVITLVVAPRGSAPRAAVTPWIGPGSAGLSGVF